MLGKLLKYELQATGRQVLPLCGAMVLYAALCRLLGALRITRPWPRLDEALASIGTFFFILLLFACCVASNIVLVVRYYLSLIHIWHAGGGLRHRHRRGHQPGGRAEV